MLYIVKNGKIVDIHEKFNKSRFNVEDYREISRLVDFINKAEDFYLEDLFEKLNSILSVYKDINWHLNKEDKVEFITSNDRIWNTKED